MTPDTADTTNQSITADDFIGQRERRIEKLRRLREMGIDPFPSRSRKDQPNQSLKDSFDTFQGSTISLTGRLTSFRDHGKIVFADLQDQSGTIQLVLKKDSLTADHANGHLGWEDRGLLDAGDHVEAVGTAERTSAGQESLFVTQIRLISKTIRPLPNTFDDKEQQFRRRYLDLTINPERKAQFERKARFWRLSRQFMHNEGFAEVEVPVLEHVTGGADATPFVTYHNDLDQNFYLRISTELYQKRLIGGGFEKIYTLGPNFRNEGSSDEHLQEFYQLEWYWAYATYRDSMELVQKMLRHLAREIYGTTTFTTRGHTFDLADQWQEIDYATIIKEHHGIDIFSDSQERMLERLNELNISLPGAINRHRLIDNLWKTIRKSIAGPAFLVNEPKFLSPLAKSKPDNPELTERFHIILGGSELGNGYSEINDPMDQLDRFLDQQALRDQGDDEAQMLDIDFIEMLEYGMPPTSGYAHSERLFWYLENCTAREGVLFPQLKHDVDALTMKIYDHRLNEHGINLATMTASPAHTTPDQSLELSITREQAFAIVDQHIDNKNLVKHCVAVEAAMRSLARHFGANEDVWGITGLLHDADWEVTEAEPTQHTKQTEAWIRETGENSEELIRAIHAHNFHYTSVEPKTIMELALYTCDELTGLITATALMQPEKTIASVTVKSVLKKFKNKKFAAAIDREQILQCESKLGISLDRFIEIVLSGMTAYADELGLS